MDQTQIFEFISRALAAKLDENKLVQEFNRLIENDFAEFAREENAMKDEAGMLMRLQKVSESFRMIATFPMIYGKRVGAVGGAVSSGKSDFINSFLPEKEVKLVTGIKTTTAIPTYVTSSEKNVSITGISYNGGKFEIAADVFKTINHDFLEHLPFSLRDVIPYITISCPMDEKYFGKLCLVDTPGYNPSKNGYSIEDYNTASKNIKNVDFLIWLVHIGQGELSRSDINFLKQLIDERKQSGLPWIDLYVVVNRAHEKPKSQIEGIVEKIKKTLDANHIIYNGICAYSSSERKVFDSAVTSQTMDIYHFLESQNIQGRTFTDLNNSINEVFDAYQDALNGQKNDYEGFQKLIKSVKLDMLKDTGMLEKDMSSINKNLRKIQEHFDTKKIDDFIQGADVLRNLFKGLISRLENYGIFSEITTLPQFLGYLSELIKRKDVKQDVLGFLETQIIAIKMIMNSDFSPEEFAKIPEILGSKGRNYFKEVISVQVRNVLAAHLRYRRGEHTDAEILLQDMCNLIAENAQELANSFLDEKATFIGEKFFAALLEESIFQKTMAAFGDDTIKGYVPKLNQIHKNYGA